VMKDGVLQQCDTPRVLYDDPVNAFVAGFIGSPPMNLIDAAVTEHGIRVGSAVLPAPSGLPARVGDALTVGLRPEVLEPTDPSDGIPATVHLVEELGAEAFVHVSIERESAPTVIPSATVVARVEPRLAPGKGERIGLRARPGSMLFFDAATGARIRNGSTAGADALR
ncbi:MAG: TOBE domain-containing protein, partial [Solirubrobacteraceae bacterium]